MLKLNVLQRSTSLFCVSVVGLIYFRQSDLLMRSNLQWSYVLSENGHLCKHSKSCFAFTDGTVFPKNINRSSTGEHGTCRCVRVVKWLQVFQPSFRLRTTNARECRIVGHFANLISSMAFHLIYVISPKCQKDND